MKPMPRTGAKRPALPILSMLPFLIGLPMLLGACSAFDSPSRVYAEQNENALQRQQAEQERPAPDNKQVYLDMIRKMQERSLYFASLAHIEAYRNSYGATPELLRLRADALRATAQAEAAETQYRELLKGPEAAAAWHGLGLLAAQRGDYVAAVADLRQANRREPTDAAVLSDLGYALLRSDERAAARLPLMQAAELAPDNRKILGNLALFLLLSDDAKKAGELMQRAGFPPLVMAEVRRQAAGMNAKALPTATAVVDNSDGSGIGAEPQSAPAAAGGGRDGNRATPMQPMLERFRRSQ